MRLKKAIRIVSVNLMLLAVGLLILELAFGDWLTSHNLNKLNLLWNQDLTFDASGLYDAGDGRVRYKRDMYALRGDYGTPDQIDILTVGGSTTDQRYITEGATWQDVLQREFVAHGKALHVANAGVDGQSTLGHLKDFEWWFPTIPGLHPRYCVLYVGLNDFWLQTAEPFDDLDAPGADFLRRQIGHKSALYHLYRTIRGAVLVRMVRAGHLRTDFSTVRWVNVPRASHHVEMMRPLLQKYAERLRLLDHKVRAMGARPVFVTQPTHRCRYERRQVLGTDEEMSFYGVVINGVDYCIMIHLQNEKTMDICKDLNGICLDLASELAFDDEDFYDEYHNTPRGAEKIGTYLFEKLKGIV